MNCQAEYREEDGWVDAEREREREDGCRDQ
jgi:hypothetical protein